MRLSLKENKIHIQSFLKRAQSNGICSSWTSQDLSVKNHFSKGFENGSLLNPWLMMAKPQRNRKYTLELDG